MNIEKYMPVAPYPKYVGVSFLQSIMYKDLYRIKDLFWWLTDSKFESFHRTTFNHNEQKGNLHSLTHCFYLCKSKNSKKKKTKTGNRTFHLLLPALQRLVFLPTKTT